jgi:hypothetical protein
VCGASALLPLQLTASIVASSRATGSLQKQRSIAT